MEPTTDRTFAEVRGCFREWYMDAVLREDARRLRGDFWQLLRDYRAGLLTDRVADERLAELRVVDYGHGMVKGIHIGQDNAGKDG